MDTDQAAEPVQPDTEGQGETGTGGSPYQDYLSRIPEDVRGQVEPVFRDWDAQTTKKFQEAAEYRKTWEPYEQAGVNSVPVEELQWFQNFRQAYNDNPQAIQQWYEDYATEHGLTAQQAAAQQQSEPDLFGEEALGGADPQQQQLLQDLQGRLDKFEQWQQQQEYQSRLSQAQQQVEQQLKGLAEKHGDEFDREKVEMFLPRHIEKDPQNAVNLAWQDYRSMVNQIQKSTLASKVDDPAPPESGGVANTNPEPIGTLQDANRIAMERLRQARSS